VTPLAITIGWDPDITEIGGLLITWHGLFTAIGILVGVQLALRIARRTDYDEDDAYTLALIGVPTGIIGARALFVIENIDAIDGFGDAIAITEGGISIWGAILGGLLGPFLFSVWRGWRIALPLDIAAIGLILGQAIGRLGDLVNGEHLAKATDLPWGVTYSHPNSPAFAHSLEVGPHHPATTYELLGDLVIFGVLLYLFFGPFARRRGLVFFTYIIGYSVMRFFLTYTRVDSAETLGGLLRVPQLVSVVVVLAAIPLLIWVLRRPPIEDGADEAEANPWFGRARRPSDAG
jgi:phosphatidylglycerol:prolipoprotein diacylglycerol transferase